MITQFGVMSAQQMGDRVYLIIAKKLYMRCRSCR